MPKVAFQSEMKALSTALVKVQTAVAKLDAQPPPTPFTRVRYPRARGITLFGAPNPQPLAKRRPAGSLGSSSTLFKGYPEYNNDQPRGKDGKWGGGGGSGFAVDQRVWSSNKAKIQRAIGIYSSLGDHYVDVNHALRLGPQLRNEPGHVPDIKIGYRNTPLRSVVEALDAFTSSHTTKADMKLYRGVYTDKYSTKFTEFLDGLKPGDMFRDDGFLSTSRQEATAREFGGLKGRGFVIEIDVPSGTRVGLLYRYKSKTRHPEQEVVLPRGSELAFVGREGNRLKFTLQGTKAHKLFKGYPEYSEDQPRGEDGQWTGGGGGSSGGQSAPAGEGKWKSSIQSAPGVEVRTDAPKRPYPWKNVILGLVAVGTAAAIAVRVRDHIVIHALKATAVTTAGGRTLTIFSQGYNPTAQRAIMQAVDLMPAAHYAALRASGLRFMTINRVAMVPTNLAPGIVLGGFYDRKMHALAVAEFVTMSNGQVVSWGFQRTVQSALHEMAHALDFGGKAVAGISSGTSAFPPAMMREFGKLASTAKGQSRIGSGWFNVYSPSERSREVFAQVYTARYMPQTNELFFHNMTHTQMRLAFPATFRGIDALRFTKPDTFSRMAG